MSIPTTPLNSDGKGGPSINADLSISFAQKYLKQVTGRSTADSTPKDSFWERRRQEMANHLLSSLRSVSAKSWIQTENFLAEAIRQHGIDTNLIDPWQVSGGIHQVYKDAITAYTRQLSPHTLVNKVGPILGLVRQQATEVDSRAIGFVAMQYHYTGMELMKLLPKEEQENFALYVKILDDHLYMPLPRAYQAAAKHPSDSQALRSVQLLMPRFSEIAERIVARVIQLYPQYRSYSGSLDSPNVRTSSIRDVEMFQVYMWVCLLENNLQALQEELFPLCVMIYPTLNVSWELIRLMTNLLHKEITSFLPAEQAHYCKPYYEILKRLFSPEVFPNT